MIQHTRRFYSNDLLFTRLLPISPSSLRNPLLPTQDAATGQDVALLPRSLLAGALDTAEGSPGEGTGEGGGHTSLYWGRWSLQTTAPKIGSLSSSNRGRRVNKVTKVTHF